jgi:hypothetical protein
MCEFASWIEKGNKVYFLTPALIQDTPKGQAWLKYEGDKSENWKDDQKGHGAIRWFFDLQSREGSEHECTDFSNPANFPAEIVKAIKAGEFVSFEFPRGLLSASLYADYKAKRAPLDADYEAKRASLYADYEAKRASLYADYEAKRAPLDADMWDLFAKPENRAEAWK